MPKRHVSLREVGMRRTPAVIGAAALVAMAASGAHAGKRDDTLNLAWRAEIENYDQYFNTVREGIVFAREVWDTLVDRDPVSGEYKPLLAKSYRWADPLTLDFELREGFVFHDGA